MPEEQQQEEEEAPRFVQQQPHDDLLRHYHISTHKLLLVALLGSLAILLGSTVVTLQWYIVRHKQSLVQQRMGKTVVGSGSATPPATLSENEPQKQQREKDRQAKIASSYSRSVKPALETKPQDLFLWKQPRQPYSTGKRATAAFYWNQVAPLFYKWDAVLQPKQERDTSTSFSSNLRPDQSRHVWQSFQQAAELGYAPAQYAYANWLASGIPPMDLPLAVLDDTNHTHSVPLDVIPTHNTPAYIRAHLYWHMAAMDGHLESALNLGYRQGISTTNPLESCQRALPYYEAAGNMIIDMLESQYHSRAKVTPPIDTHVLSELHTSQRQQWHNAPDEPSEALQYYHMRATQNADVGAMYTLANLYHYGLRGVVQNMTLALTYYDMASQNHHWEAAGQAGKFHVWGMGMPWNERNLYQAHKYFSKGAPNGLDGCMQRYRQHKSNKDTQLCDHPSLNGLGLLHLLGVPMLVPVDLEKAKKYFSLARDMGNPDAMYNLAMIRIGWKSYFVELSELRDDNENSGDGSVVGDGVPRFVKEQQRQLSQQPTPTKADYLVALQDLIAAANKGHLQARHRVAMMYSSGVNITTGKGKHMSAIAKDCNKALKHYSWMAEHASPMLSLRTRKAYKQYMAGDYESSLRNYLAAAETGSELAQINAAFLLEQGVCLGLDATQCAAASTRLWKAAVGKNPEAALRVGDMYYYGRLRSKDGATAYGVGPFGWLPLVLFPERHAMPVMQELFRKGAAWFRRWVGEGKEEKVEAKSSELAPTCEAGEDGTCAALSEAVDDTPPSTTEGDLAMAARYYKLASEKHKSPRANFNLGYMHEWGLGLKQDFPLAKRHYDLAASVKNGDADLAAQIALTAMNVHERILKFYVAWKDWWRDPSEDKLPTLPVAVPRAIEAVGHPLPSSSPEGSSTIARPRTKVDVILSHVFSWESLLIVVLTLILSKLLQHRRTGR